MDEEWTGTGSVYITFFINSSEFGYYVFTDGKSFSELGITDLSAPEELDNLPRFNIVDSISAIDISRFYDVRYLQ